MKKLVAIILALMLIASMAIPAYAVTPTLNIPDVPQISNIKFDVDVKVSQGFWDRWFADHPVKFDFSNIKFGG